MKISKFAEKHGVTQDTIRYYLDKGLLVTKKKGGQYLFTEADSKDLEKIIELKGLDFSLTEIQSILTYQRLSGANTDVFRSLYLSLLEEKKKQVSKELLKYSRLNNSLKDIIHGIKAEELRENEKLGFPLVSLGILSCPICASSINVMDGAIGKNCVMDANIYCPCGYSAIIKDGIYIDEKAVKTKTMNGKEMPTKEEFLANTTHSRVNFLYQGINTLTEYIENHTNEPKYIMELNTCVGFFLLQYIKYLPSKATYILVDYDIDRIKSLKSNLEKYYNHSSFIFLCCDLNSIPLTRTSIDVMIDFGVTQIYDRSNNISLFHLILPLLKENAIIAGLYTFMESDISNRKNLDIDLLEHYSKDKILKKLASTNLNILEKMDIGPVSEDNPFLGLREIELYKMIFVGRKSMTE